MIKIPRFIHNKNRKTTKFVKKINLLILIISKFKKILVCILKIRLIFKNRINI